MTTTSEPITAAQEPRTTRVGARWRIVWWIVATTGLTLLVVLISLRSVLNQQVAEIANAEIVQESNEFRTYAEFGEDPNTAQTFSSALELVESYLQIQTPASGEILIGVVDGEVLYVDNTAEDAGTALVQDATRLDGILADPASSGVADTDDGAIRWGKVSVTATDPAGNEQNATLVTVHFIADDMESNDQEILILLCIGAGGLVLTAGVGWLVAGRILAPLRSMREVARSISSQNLSGRVPVPGRDDISELAVTMNEMLDRVESAHSSQRHFIAEARRRVGDPQARAARAVAHLAEYPNDERVREMSRNVGTELRRMRDVLDELDILAQADSPDFLTPRSISLHELASAAYSRASSNAPGYLWSFNSRAEGVGVLDPERVLQAMDELIANAAAHTPVGATVEIGSAMSDDGQAISLWVADPGTDLEPKQAEMLFEFYRTQTEEADTGMGLGLAVVRAVADAHYGTAWVEVDPAVGTRIGMDLPVAVLSPQDEPADDPGVERSATHPWR